MNTPINGTEIFHNFPLHHTEILKAVSENNLAYLTEINASLGEFLKEMDQALQKRDHDNYLALVGSGLSRNLAQEKAEEDSLFNGVCNIANFYLNLSLELRRTFINEIRKKIQHKSLLHRHLNNSDLLFMCLKQDLNSTEINKYRSQSSSVYENDHARFKAYKTTNHFIENQIKH